MTPQRAAPFDAYAWAITVHQQEAARCAERVFAIVMTPAGVNMRDLCDEAASHLAGQIMAMQRAFADFDMTDRATLRRVESAIVDAFQARMGELLGTIRAAGRA